MLLYKRYTSFIQKFTFCSNMLGREFPRSILESPFCLTQISHCVITIIIITIITHVDVWRLYLKICRRRERE